MFGLDNTEYDHLDKPEREKCIRTLLEPKYSIVASREFSPDLLYLAHAPDYIEFVRAHNRSGLVSKADCQGYLQDSDSFVWLDENTFDAAKNSVDTALTAATLIYNNQTDIAYALCRPSGHHAGKNKMGGYCYFNNTAIASLYLRNFGFNVGIIDIDRHAGNGTHEIILGQNKIYFVSLHITTTYPWRYSHNDRYNNDEQNVKIYPIDENESTDSYIKKYYSGLELLVGKGAEVLVISLGLDTSIHDLQTLADTGTFGLQTSYYERLGKMAANHNRKVLVIQEGGYNLAHLSENLGAFLTGLTM
ncbi:MAG: hypothetical protein V1859_02415 [archaeon]